MSSDSGTLNSIKPSDELAIEAKKYSCMRKLKTIENVFGSIYFNWSRNLLLLGWIVLLFPVASGSAIPSLIKIRGGPTVQHLPISLVRSWRTFTFDPFAYSPLHSLSEVERNVENEGNEDGNERFGSSGWINPTSFSDLYLPSDLPIPKATASLGCVVSSGVVRYLMPSVILSLETPDRIWRNRGLCSLPRARVWLDLFSPFMPPVSRLTLSCYGKVMNDLRFLEDQDGATAWQSLLNPSVLSIDDALKTFKSELLNQQDRPESERSRIWTDLLDGSYHFVDIPLIHQGKCADLVNFSRNHLRSFISDFDDPRRLLEIIGDDEEIINNEPVGVLDVKVTEVAPGSQSKFLPEVYTSLYEEGNIIT